MNYFAGIEKTLIFLFYLIYTLMKFFVLETPPVIVLEPPDNPATVPPLGSISVRCTATGIPPPIITWIIGTNASDVTHEPDVQLINLRKDETATCKAENSAGQVQEVLQILVAGLSFSYFVFRVFMYKYKLSKIGTEV